MPYTFKHTVSSFSIWGRARWRTLAWVLLVACTLAGCTHMQLLASYDDKTYEETIRIGREVDVHYARLVELAPELRHYAASAPQYVEIEADIRSLVRRNAARPLNEESQKISGQILKFWTQYRDKHREKDAYPDARFDSDRFSRLFNAAVAAEEVKRLQTDDRN
ncbi:MAG: hypothetical protein Q7U28_01770 [Aquabacterium sp.]|nr:hypothetical protein [Aquabacterium sp.]